MIELSSNTLDVITTIFGDSAETTTLKRRLIEDCSENTSISHQNNLKSMERIWFAIIKLCMENQAVSMEEWFQLARIDPRDLLVAAGFEHDVLAHEKWAETLLGRPSVKPKM